MEPLSFQKYISSLDPASLPRVVKICSGVYFQGSVYEMAGSECCLSTGDLLKIVAVQLQRVTCENVETGQSTELPLNFTGRFKLSPDKLPFTSLEEFAKTKPPGLQAMPCYFISAADLSIDGQIIPKGQSISLVSVTTHEGREYASCITSGPSGHHSFWLPFSFRGTFYPCSGQQHYTLSEALQAKELCGQHLKCSKLGTHTFLLCPEYEVQAIMHMRKDVVKIPSSLEVDVEDVTEESQHIHFIKPLMLSEVLKLQDIFPVQAEILDGPEYPPIFENDWIARLHKGQKIQIHNKVCAWRILASSRKGSRHFLLSSTYQGRFRRRPREFPTVYDLAMSLGSSKRLRVVVTRDCESNEENLPSLSIGDRLEVLHLVKANMQNQAQHQAADVLLCSRSCGDEDEDDEENEELLLPLYLDGGFVEEMGDSKKYTLPEIVEQFQLPCEVRMTAKDSSLAHDILGSYSMLRLEAQITETFLVTSLCEEPDASFEIPPQWVDMSLFLTEERVPVQTHLTDMSKIEVLTESFYYQLVKLLPGTAVAPPRPPKRRECKNKTGPQKTREERVPEKPKQPPPGSKPKSAPQEPLNLKPSKMQSNPIARSTPNEYDTQPCLQKPRTPKRFLKNDGANSSDSSEHDYEVIEKDVEKTIHKMETALHW
ncbi:protein THEMIS2 [Alligator mississippiensis]|uniref:Protein THEMIS2 n=1 Tax=Alligator mississippiensis TaxID=8496 RepID=A0A151PGX8_ALLMI|nr:protein THEMIS2 [Alligator mississippiensis]